MAFGYLIVSLLAQVEKLLARLSDRVSELTQVTAQGDNSALCAQLLVRACFSQILQIHRCDLLQEMLSGCLHDT